MDLELLKLFGGASGLALFATYIGYQVKLLRESHQKSFGELVTVMREDVKVRNEQERESSERRLQQDRELAETMGEVKAALGEIVAHIRFEQAPTDKHPSARRADIG